MTEQTLAYAVLILAYLFLTPFFVLIFTNDSKISYWTIFKGVHLIGLSLLATTVVTTAIWWSFGVLL